MTYLLALRAAVPPICSEISSAEFDAIKCARAVLQAALRTEEKFDLAIDNYAEYEREMMNLAIHKMLHQDFQWSTGADGRYLIARRLANVLTVSRSYTDQLSQEGRIILGQDAKSAISLVFSQQYERSIGYRVMVALRNHLQHCGFPIDLSFPFAWEGEGRTSMRIGITPTLNLRELDVGTFKSTVYKELLAIEKDRKKSNINLLLREYIEGLNRVHIYFRESIAVPVESARSEFERVIQFGRERLGPNIGSLAAIALGDDGSETEVLGIFGEISDRRALLVRRNPALPTLSRWYVTGEAS
ncbi:hypothetical protein [uncultured Paludibaculum sp.]|uniref:hypothetical protein n=1 Tax=uncultured Paludibaculum sp. TaxID=1765020 RepID=UPI002AAB04E7|nr:hypothetical protein [uncultured Paludibaculum sp.]